MEIGEYLAALRKRWWVILVLAVLGAGIGYQQAQASTPMYRSTAKVFVSLARGDTVADLVQGSTYTRNLVESYVQLATVPAVLEPVAEQLDLPVSAKQLASVVHAEAPLDTMLIEISASSRSAQRASDIANAVANQLSETVETLSPTSADGVASVKITMVGEATPAGVPFSPNTKLLVATGGALGLAIGFAIALAWARLDTRVRGAGDLPREPARPLLGLIPYDRSISSEGPRTIIEHPRGALAEAYRRVRANLDFLDSTDPVRAFVVTSTVPREGKSTTSVSLALALADTGRRVLLVDADLRRPAVARICGLEGEVGLTTILARKATLADVRQPWGIEGLDVVTAGRVPPNPTQLIDSVAIAAFLEEAKATYDMVIVDTSPLLAVSDAAVLARRTNGAIVVARARKVDRHGLQEALTTLDTLGAPCLGLVLNGGPRQRRATSYGYMEPRRRPRLPRRGGKGGPAEVSPETSEVPVVPASAVLDVPATPEPLDPAVVSGAPAVPSGTRPVGSDRVSSNGSATPDVDTAAAPDEPAGRHTHTDDPDHAPVDGHEHAADHEPDPDDEPVPAAAAPVPAGATSGSGPDVAARHLPSGVEIA
ncbi:polysaccharide biosynthesis tyrosine autokinase [Cellulomonas sp.]|uniref:polysaccharide biosynthesis tyrosine autokinase n=1 Tax=Cellulomonas sp. TaxID=40001 RepID=UPI001B09705D|nr:polysaccharide biosynthesis tyrosine autokinase [Cellulomonas sp.]MBO9553272.1 polysaccharide biosynthesis tyrosine autokinase [Cellulomonas sp.]